MGDGDDGLFVSASRHQARAFCARRRKSKKFASRLLRFTAGRPARSSPASVASARARIEQARATLSEAAFSLGARQQARLLAAGEIWIAATRSGPLPSADEGRVE
jgi:hypothetical protein